MHAASPQSSGDTIWNTLTLYQSRLLEAFSHPDKSTRQPRLRHGFTGKPVSFGGRSYPPETLRQNRKLLCEVQGLNYDRLIVPNQTHSANIKSSRDTDFSDTDAVILLDAGIPAFIQTADCVPVLLYAPDKHIGAVIHAGWRGTAARITPITALRMHNDFGVDLSQLIAVIGPAITQACYEVSEEVLQALADSIPDNDQALFSEINANSKPQVDIKTVNRLQLEALHVQNIEVIPACTGQDIDKLWSYRRGEDARQVLFLQLS